MEIDSFDLKILNELDCDARQSYSEVGKKIRRSKQFVANRIKLLEQKKIIEEYVLDSNLRATGYSLFSVFVQFQKIDKLKEMRILNYLNKSKYVGYSLKTIGNWDLFISIKAKNVTDFYNFLGGFHRQFKGLIKKESINLEVRGIDTNLKFLNESRRGTSYCFVNNPADQVLEFNDIERQIIWHLRTSPLLSYLELSEKIGKTYSTVKKIVQNLKEKNIIKRTKAKINAEKLGYNRYLFLIDLHYLGNEKTANLLNYLKQHKDISYIIECVGSWNLICNVYSKTFEDLVSIRDDLSEKFSDLISSVEILNVIKNERELFELLN